MQPQSSTPPTTHTVSLADQGIDPVANLGRCEVQVRRSYRTAKQAIAAHRSGHPGWKSWCPNPAVVRWHKRSYCLIHAQSKGILD